jgi:hypothetical protein
MRSKTMNMSEGRPLKLLTQQPFGSLGMALTTYAGQNYGAAVLPENADILTYINQAIEDIS